MTSAEAILKLQLLLDKTGSPYFTTDEYLSFLNMAQLEVLNRIVPDSLGGVVNYEADENIAINIRRLSWRIDIISSSFTTSENSMSIPLSTITTTLRSVSSDSSCEIFRFSSVGIFETGTPFNISPVKYTKFNNFNKYTKNVFKAPSTSNYLYTVDSLDLFIAPQFTRFARLQLIKTPKIMTAGNSPDWDDYVMNQVIQVAYQMATVATRDEAGLQLGTSTTIQSK